MYNILIVDDERIERNGIIMLLKRLSINAGIVEAANGKEAYEYLCSDEAEHIDILYIYSPIFFLYLTYLNKYTSLYILPLFVIRILQVLFYIILLYFLYFVTHFSNYILCQP